MASVYTFPDPNSADATGLVAVTDEINADMLLEAYGHGIFPWSEDPVRWFCPEPRAILVGPYIRLPKKIGKTMRRHELHVTFDSAFRAVIEACSNAHREEGEWISTGFVRAYSELHERGYAHSVEVWQGSDLVGGLYGVQLGAMFAGESMFYNLPNASKVAFTYLVHHLARIGVVLIDAQVLNQHTTNLGAALVHRRDFLAMLQRAMEIPAHFVGERWPSEPGFDLSIPGTNVDAARPR